MHFSDKYCIMLKSKYMVASAHAFFARFFTVLSEIIKACPNGKTEQPEVFSKNTKRLADKAKNFRKVTYEQNSEQV